MATIAIRGSPDLTNGNSNYSAASRSYEEELEYTPSANEGPYPQPTPKTSSGPSASGPSSRSFSARAAVNLNYTTRKPGPVAPPGLNEESTTPRDHPPAEYLHGPKGPISGIEKPQPPPEAPAAPSVPSPPTRSNTVRSTSGASAKRDWASDRSPLQKLEVTLNGISKEEKRARVQEAEMRVRERIARQKIEKEQAEAAAAASTPRPNSKQSAHSKDHDNLSTMRKNTQKETLMEETARAAPRPMGATAVRHNRAASINPQYPAIRQPEDPRYAGAENARSSQAKMGSLPRRSATVREPSTKEELPSEKLMRTRSVSQQGPPRSLQPVVPLSNTERIETPPAAKSSSGTSLPRSKPRQTVSFDVPPPTPPPIFEWRNAPVARLGGADFDFQHLDIDRSKAWWEGGASADRRKSRALPKNYQTAAQKLTGKSY